MLSKEVVGPQSLEVFKQRHLRRAEVAGVTVVP